MAFTTVMTTTAEISPVVTEELVNEFIAEYVQRNTMDALVQFNRQIGAKSISFSKYGALAAITSALTEDADVTSVAMSSSTITLTPAEYGSAVTLTKLADLQSGGREGRAVMVQVADQMARSRDKLAIAALDAGSNTKNVGDIADGSLAASNVLDGATLNKVYNKLARANVPFHSGREFILVAHDDVIHDLRDGAAAGTWMDIVKYNEPGMALANEVGMYRGFRIIRNNHCTLDVDGGAGNVDIYNSYALGFNALGLAESMVPEIRVTGPFDKLSRFVNVGWYGVFQYKLIDTTASWKIHSASSVGSN